MREMYDAFRGGDVARAHEIDRGLQPIYEALAVTSNPIPVKAALEMLGLIPGGLRLPMVPADEEQRSRIRAALESRGLLAASTA
jgi:4-hydroxy-tetrahydrodipicolinate synthase